MDLEGYLLNQLFPANVPCVSEELTAVVTTATPPAVLGWGVTCMDDMGDTQYPHAMGRSTDILYTPERNTLEKKNL